MSIITGAGSTRLEAGPWTAIAADSLILADGKFNNFINNLPWHDVTDDLRIFAFFDIISSFLLL